MRPELNKNMKIEEFKDFYWLKKELQEFCQKNGLSKSGSKLEIADRIETFLRTGDIKKPEKLDYRTKKFKHTGQLSLDTVITEHHRCSQEVRAFFKEIIPNFHFSTYIQTFFKNNVGKTYRDAVKAWYAEQERKKDPSYKKQIGPQFEYNQFIHDFFQDPNNKGKHRNEAIKEWNRIKNLPGSNNYNENKK